MDTQYTSILKRVGAVLLVVGLIDIAVMIYCIANRISYSSSFNIFAVAGGIFLLRGSLRAASIIRWIAVFMLAAFVAFLIAWPFMQPFALTLAQIHLNPGALIATFAFMALLLGLLVWLIRELGREPVMTARSHAGRKQRDLRIPAAGGVVSVIAMGVFMALLLGGESADRAKFLAKQQVGPDYRVHVSSLNIAKNNQGTFVSGVVTAWNDSEIRYIPVQWEER
jgi:hypothetical protein